MASDYQSTPNLIQGVTQQSPQQARDSQCREQFDCINDASYGCVARPPFEVVKSFPGRVYTGAAFVPTSHNREQYLAVFRGNTVSVLDLITGDDCVVTANLADGYLAAGSSLSKDKIRSQVVEDTVFIANREKTIAMSGVRSPSTVREALVYCSGGAFDTEFRINLYIDGVLSVGAMIKTSADNTSAANPGYILTQLASQISAAGWNVDKFVGGSSMRLTHPSGSDFTVTSSDSTGDTLLLVFKETAQSFAKLPARAYGGMMLRVKGEDRSKADDYYVRYTGDYSTGSWEEVIGPNLETNLEPSTMPHLLTNTGFQTFTFGPASWSSRLAGDDDVTPLPSFIGKGIRDLFYFSRRMGFLCENSVVYSKARYPFTWFPDTAQAVLATAPIDASLIPATDATQGASDLDFLTQLDDTMFAWSPSAQYRIHSYDQALTQDTIESGFSTAYEYSQTVRPIPIGQLMYFASDSDVFSTVRTIQYQGGKPIGDSDITSHIPSYLPAGMRQFVASDTLRHLFMHNEGSNLYLYNWLRGSEGLIQSAWNTWRLPPGSILWAGIKSNVLRVLMQRPEGVVLLKLDLNVSSVDSEVYGLPNGYRTRLDMLVHSSKLTITYNSTTNESSFSLPYTPSGNTFKAILLQDVTPTRTRGVELKVLGVSGATVRIQGDVRGFVFATGEIISAEREELPFYLRTQDGQVAVDSLRVDDIVLDMAKTGYTRIEVTYAHKGVKSTPWEGRVLGAQSSRTETLVPSDGKLKAAVGEDNTNVSVRLVNDSYLPSRWVSLSWGYTAVGRKGLGGK